MPGGDRTGPLGAGPRTGRAAGFCAGYKMPGYANPIPGYGFGYGFRRGFRGGYGRGFGQGLGRGLRRSWGSYEIPPWGASSPYSQPGYYPPFDEKASISEEINSLKSQEKYLANALKDLRKRIEEIESGQQASTQP